MAKCRETFQFIIDGKPVELSRAIDAGFDVNEPDQYGLLLIHQACANHRPDIVSLLIQSGSKVNETATDDWTPLHHAAVSGAVTRVGKTGGTRSHHLGDRR